jgi:solute carrier family 13 (sodium-dependent dicarboxylate transporter), member 2/3/5
MGGFVRFLIRRRWILAGFLLGGIILLMPPPAGLTAQGLKALAIASVAILFFVTEPLPLPTVAILIGVFEVLLGITGPTEVSRSFISDSLLFILGSLMIAETIVKQKLDKRLALFILRITGPRVERIVVGLITVSALIASLIGEHTVVAMMMPVGMTLIASAGPEPRQLKNLSSLILLSIAYGAIAAGVGSPSGGARNAIVISYWRQLFHLNIGYLHWMEYLYPMVVLQIPIVAFVLLKTFRPEVVDLTHSIEQLRIRVAQEGTMNARDNWTVVIFLITVVLWISVSDQIGLGTTAMIGVALYLISGIARWEDYSRGINWGIIVIYAGAISLGIAMRDTGAAGWVAQILLQWVEPLGLHGGIGLLFFVALLTMSLATVMSSGATVGLLAPITLHMAELSGTSIVAAGLVTAAASAFTYMTTMGSPACGMVYSSGQLRRGDFLKAGWKMNMASLSLLLLIAFAYWSLLTFPAGVS